MNLCFITDRLENSGDEKNLIILLNKLHEAGHTISIFLLKAERSPDYCDYATFYTLGLHGNPVSVYRRRKEKLHQLIKERTFDLLISFGVTCNMLSLLSFPKKRPPLLICERHDPQYVPKSRFIRWWRNKLYTRGDGFVFQTREQMGWFEPKIQAKGVVIPNFITVDCQDVSASDKERVITTYTRMDNRQKNLSMLFDGFAAFSKIYPEYSLRVYGTGPDSTQCKQYVKSRKIDWNIKFMGEPQSFTDLLSAEVFVLTSNFEGFPNHLLSAMALGMACVSTNCGGACQLIENGKNGVLVEKDDATTLKDALCYFAEHTEVREALSKNALYVRDVYSPEQIIPLWQQAIEKFAK